MTLRIQERSLNARIGVIHTVVTSLLHHIQTLSVSKLPYKSDIKYIPMELVDLLLSLYTIRLGIMTLRNQEMNLNAGIGVSGYTPLLHYCYITYKLSAFLNDPIRVI